MTRLWSGLADIQGALCHSADWEEGVFDEVCAGCFLLRGAVWSTQMPPYVRTGALSATSVIRQDWRQSNHTNQILPSHSTGLIAWLVAGTLVQTF